MTTDSARGTRTRGANGGSAQRRTPKRIQSTSEHADHNGQSLVTRNHDVIMRWAEERRAKPSTVARKDGDRPGVLRFDFPGYGGQALEHVDWDAWFDTFDQRGIDFIYQEKLKSGQQSNFFRLDNPKN